MVSADKIWIESGTVDLELNAIAASIDYRQFLLSDKLESYIDYRITYPEWSGINYIVNATLGLRYSFIDFQLMAYDALIMAKLRRQPRDAVLIHSDQGSQYGSHDYMAFIEANNFIPSMSRRGTVMTMRLLKAFLRHLRSK